MYILLEFQIRKLEIIIIIKGNQINKGQISRIAPLPAGLVRKRECGFLVTRFIL